MTRGKSESLIAPQSSILLLLEGLLFTQNFMGCLTYYCNAFKEPLEFDVQLYNIALYILLGALLLFIVLAIIGLYLFVKGSTDNKTNELALYRSLGYKSTHIFYILFSEYMVFRFISVILGSFITVVVEHFFVNPYLYSLVGNSIMEIKTSVNIFDVVAILLFFIAVLFLYAERLSDVQSILI
ncbi:MAG: FtsX-like permease family protein [Ruminococcus bromii]|nr:FtsX-like permease family protein [Ruminococcus bromii]